MKLSKQEILQRVRLLQRGLDEILDAVISLEEVAPKKTVKPTSEIKTASDDNTWLSPTAASKCLGISKSTFFKWVNEGNLPPGIRFSPRERRWRMSEIIAWQNERKTNYA